MGFRVTWCVCRVQGDMGGVQDLGETGYGGPQPLRTPNWRSFQGKGLGGHGVCAGFRGHRVHRV
jgi:hypothetical protein